MKEIVIQPQWVTEGFEPDLPTPYPVIVDSETGELLSTQAFAPYGFVRVAGFTGANERRISITLEKFLEDPSQVVGHFVVMATAAGRTSSLSTPIASVRVVEAGADYEE